jgi:hypothetical protein
MLPGKTMTKIRNTFPLRPSSNTTSAKSALDSPDRLAELNLAIGPNFVSDETSTEPVQPAAASKTPSVQSSPAQLLGERQFDQDLAAAKHLGDDMLFTSWNKKLHASLLLAYALYLHVLLDPTCVDAILNDPGFRLDRQGRKRSLSPTKKALICVQYVTRPITEEDRKSASAYSCMLIFARHNEVEYEEFPERMRTVTMLEARRFVRDLRRPPGSDQRPRTAELFLSYRREKSVVRKSFPILQPSCETDLAELIKQVTDFLNSLGEVPVN